MMPSATVAASARLLVRLVRAPLSAAAPPRGAAPPPPPPPPPRAYAPGLEMDAAAAAAAAAAPTTAPPELFAAVRALVPPLAAGRRKGEAGRVAVVGGCAEYTGAPYFAALSALRAGADLAHVFCSAGAAPVIKSYSPELIVHGYLPDEGEGDSPEVEAAIARVLEWLPRFDAVVVGPGLGRGAPALALAAAVVAEARALGLPLCLDADALWLAARRPELVRGCAAAVLTPNVGEFGRLAEALGVDAGAPGALAAVAAALGGPAVVRKGGADALADGRASVVCAEPGAPRRAGGQGDVLAGTIAAFAAWARGADGGWGRGASPVDLSPLMVAAYSGCLVTRVAARRAYAAKGRAMGAPDLIAELGPTLDAWVNDF
jgi:ATP-dependent NAD(P)H-hydrate dehydratase